MTTNQPSNHLLKALVLGSAILLGLAAALFATPAGENLPESVAVFVIDDQTGEELASKHGIQPLTVGDLEVLINAVLQGATPVKVLHQAVDEEAGDNAVAALDFRPYGGGQPPKAPSPGLPLSQLATAVQAYRKLRAEWQQGMLAYRQDLIVQIERFISGVTATQLEVSERFDRMLAGRGGRDFNRSDIAGAVLAANRMLGCATRRVLVLNTDAVDLPAGRVPRTTPFTPEELDPTVRLVFVNTSGVPDKSPLFRGLPNPVQHADSLKAAMELVMQESQASAGQPKATDSSFASR